MDRTSNSEWNDEMDIRNFGDLLERMNSPYNTNQESPQYHSGFVPATNHPWTSQHSHPHMLQMDPTLNNSPLGTQVGLNPLRSFSVSQPPYPGMDCSRTPLMRSSSDLGVRLNHFPTPGENFPECQLQGIDPHIETLDSSVFYPPNPHFHSSSSYQQMPVSNNEKILISQNPGIHYGPYVTESCRSQQNEQSSNFSSKLSNFTASLSLGTWLSPLDQIRTDYNQGMQISETSVTTGGIRENSSNNNNIQTSSIMSSKSVETSSNFCKEPKPQINPKPRYSDVLSKAPTHEAKSFNNIKTNNQQNSSYKLRESSNKCSNSRHNKHRNNIGFGRSSSPNLAFHNSTNHATDNSNINAKNLKFDSKVGLDEFDLPASISQCNSNSVNNTVSNGSNNSESERTKKRTTSNNNESSPCHQYKKGSKFEKPSGEKIQDEGESSHCDKLNNHSLSTQQKQTPKRTTYINNNFTSFSVNASKNSNSENNNSSNSSSISSNTSNASASTLQNRKNFSAPKDDDSKVHLGESSGNVSSSKYVCNISSSSVPLNSGSSLNKSSGSNSNFRSSRYANRAERNRENQNKKNNNAYSKKKKEASPYTHSELLMTGWTVCLLWAGKASLWLLSLVTDVAQMSYRLFIHFSLRLFEKGKIYCAEAKHAFKYYWTKSIDYLFRKKSDGKKGRNDRKFPFGLENKIPLPTTGEEAMKRLLACRGKDPYSILGVTRDCTDDDIKKYYKRQAFLVHPDKNKQPGAEEAFKILAHAFEIIGEPERREAYNNKLAEEAHLEGASSELASLLNLLKEKLEEAANTIRCTNCNKRHRRTKLPRPVYAARHCAECQIKHAAREV
ncbi:DnaJ-like protein subfamily C member 14, partial [Armadillidium nasatum]